ncbi:MAG: hypothetical protein WC716_16570 [Chitinophagaceae bacterium]
MNYETARIVLKTCVTDYMSQRMYYTASTLQNIIDELNKVQDMREFLDHIFPQKPHNPEKLYQSDEICDYCQRCKADDEEKDEACEECRKEIKTNGKFIGIERVL